MTKGRVEAGEILAVFEPGTPFLHYPYVVDRLLGAGFSGQVYAVTHRFTGERFALEVLHLDARKNARKVARSLIQARANYRIQHHNVVRIVDLACEEDGTVWQLMELVEGQTIAELLRRGARFSPLFALEIAIEIAWALRAAHELQIIHRDVKPSNVILTSGGVVKVLDFSLAKVIPEGFHTTHGKGGLGTTAFMAPENLNGDGATPRFDVYSLGIVLWNMLAGRHPFEDVLSDGDALIHAQLHVEAASLSGACGLPAVLDEIVRNATAKEPGRRYAGIWPMAQAMLAAHAQILRSPGAAWIAQQRQPWEVAIVRDPRGRAAYSAPEAALVSEGGPAVVEARVIVEVGAVARPSGDEAATGAGVGGAEADAPVRTGRRPDGGQRAGAAVVLACFAVGLGVVLWLALGR